MPALLVNTEITLAELLRGMVDAPDIPITGIADDSRALQAGNVFFACKGMTSHGLDFLDQAVAAKVSAVVFDSATGSPAETGLPMIPFPGLTNHLGEIANRWFDSPSKQLRVTGVTGTNGKTTVAWLVRHCLDLLSQKCGYIGTLGTRIAGFDNTGTLTTPPCIELHRTLANFRDSGAVHAAVEVSSHALEQNRVDGVYFDTAIFTNLTRDHIDYHGTMEAYFESKARLFLEHEPRNRIVNLDSEFGAQLADRCGPDAIIVSTRTDRIANGRPHVFVNAVAATPAGFDIVITSSWGSAEIALPLIGEFNITNAVQVIAVMLCNDVALTDAGEVLGRVQAPPGRMQPVVVPAKSVLPTVYVDYSHTPASLEAALTALRAHCSGKLWCVFGCGGDRDPGKRAMMGQIAGRLADVPVVTSDNPRTEDPDRIIGDIVEGMTGDVTTMVDRRAAIAHAISSANSEDIILVAGKGHEDYQVIGTERLPFSDVDVSAEHLAMREQSGGGSR